MTCENEPCTYKLALNEYSGEHTSKYDGFYDIPCARVSQCIRKISYGIGCGLNSNVLIHLVMYTKNGRTMTNVDSANLCRKQHCANRMS